MKRILPLLLLLLPLLAFAQELPRHKKPKATEDTNVLDITQNRGTSIGYETPKELRARFEKDANLNMWTDSVKAEKYRELPLGGWIRLGIVRRTIESADTRWFTVVVQDYAGNEKFRKVLKPSVASPFHVSTLTFWRSLYIIGLDKPLLTGDKIFVIDQISKSRFEYLIKNEEGGN